MCVSGAFLPHPASDLAVLRGLSTSRPGTRCEIGTGLASNMGLRQQLRAYVLDMSRGKNRSTSQSNPTRTFFSVVGSIER